MGTHDATTYHCQRTRTLQDSSNYYVRFRPITCIGSQPRGKVSAQGNQYISPESNGAAAADKGQQHRHPERALSGGGRQPIAGEAIVVNQIFLCALALLVAPSVGVVCCAHGTRKPRAPARRAPAFVCPVVSSSAGGCVFVCGSWRVDWPGRDERRERGI